MMRLPNLILLLCCLALGAYSAGCQTRSNSRYTPASATARQAIETALSRWKSGAKYGTNADSTPTVIVEEPRWKSGAKLENYEIVEEVLGKDYPHFKVKLNFVGKPEVTTEYLVIGIDPPIVYSKEEYDLTSGKKSGM
jgi:Ni/Co efflux regulator RcnB